MKLIECFAVQDNSLIILTRTSTDLGPEHDEYDNDQTTKLIIHNETIIA
jgi:hypothetical protein